jgi:ubiquinone/menaquinone biosynthesis C-methylase UbiE
MQVAFINTCFLAILSSTLSKMSGIKKITNYFLSRFGKQKSTEPEKAYDLWSDSYDNQPGNLMLDLDENLFSEFIFSVDLKNKIVVDVGCGTGRHWKKIFEKKPAQLIGYDVSQGMLEKLRQKFPEAETHYSPGSYLPELKNNFCDLIISTLTIAHIKNLRSAFEEWNRILKPDGEIFITDYHPDVLKKGGTRTFKNENKIIMIKNYIHSIDSIQKHAKEMLWAVKNFEEIKIGESMKHYYQIQNALEIFEKFKGSFIIYCMHLKKRDDFK